MRVGFADTEKYRYVVVEPAETGCKFKDIWSLQTSQEGAIASAENLGRKGRSSLILKVIGEYIPPPPQPVTGFHAYKD